jgi:hypothetical protein
MVQQWSTMFGISLLGQATIDWELFFHSISTQAKHVQPFMTKYNSRVLPVGINLKRRRHSDSAVCPCCGEHETHEHLIQCSHSKMEQAFNDSVADIPTILTQGTSEDVGNSIIRLLEYFRTGEESDAVHPTDQLYSRAKKHGAFVPSLQVCGLINGGRNKISI